MAKVETIGIDTLQHVADEVFNNVVLGPGYANPQETERMHVKIITGIQFQQTRHILVRKGGLTRRKDMSKDLEESKIGYIKERPIIAKLSYIRLRDNADNYTETVFGVDGQGNYPFLVQTVESVLKTFAEDIAANKWFGDIENGDEGMDLYNGWMTDIQNAIADGDIAKGLGNYLEHDPITMPTDPSDTAAYDAIEDWVVRLNPRLKEKCLIYCDVKRGIYIARAYANKFGGNFKVDYTVGKSYKIPELGDVEIVPLASLGEGDCLIATVEENFQFAVDTLSNETYCDVAKDTSKDNRDLVFQCQAKNGANVFNLLPYAFTISDGSFDKSGAILGDYKETLLIVNADGGSVTVDGNAYEADKSYPESTTVTLKATAASGKTFKYWVVGNKTLTDAEITVVLKGMASAFTAVFE